MALIVGLSVGLSGMLIVGLIFGLFARLVGGPPRVGLAVGLKFGLFFGLIGGLISGGLFALRHLALRLFLWVSGAAPLHYPAFVAQAKDLLFLRQVGGGYIFVHRLLRDYFASLAGSENEIDGSVTKYATPQPYPPAGPGTSA